MTAFAPLLELLEAVPDPRRAEGKVYRLPHVLLFSILAIVSGGNSYRSVATFIDEPVIVKEVVRCRSGGVSDFVVAEVALGVEADVTDRRPISDLA